MTVYIQPVGIYDSRGEVNELIREHWEEVALNKKVMRLDPDWDLYKRMEAEGRAFALGAFQGSAMVGYVVMFLMRHVHYKEMTIAMNDVLFVRKTHRKGRTGLRLIQEAEEVARRKGAQLVTWHAKPDTALADLLPKLGYGVQDIVFSREV